MGDTMEKDAVLIEPRVFWPDFETLDERSLLCVNHPDLRWYSKNIYSRNLHYLSWETSRECRCPISDLRVIVL